jgi:hypothetical protein
LAQLEFKSKVSPEKYMTPEQVASVFSNIRDLRECNAKLRDLLSERIDKWHPYQKIGDIFLQMVRISMNTLQFSRLMTFSSLFIPLLPRLQILQYIKRIVLYMIMLL